MIDLDRTTHTYSPNLPSVTQILKDAGLINTQWFTDEARDRGSMIHLACEYYDQGDLNESSIDPDISGYLEAYKAFKRYAQYEPEWIEVPQKDPTGVYAGTADRIVISRPRSLDDIKSGPYQPWHRIQSAAYVNMMDDPFSFERRGIYLKASGTYSIRVFPKTEYMHDLAIFQSALNLYYWKRRNNGGGIERS